MLERMAEKSDEQTPSLSATPHQPPTGTGKETLVDLERDRTGTERWTRTGPENDLSSYMHTFTISERYRPAYLHAGKETIIIYYVRHPDTGVWVRKKEKLNWVKDPATRKKFAQQRIRDLNMKLGIGWNPILDAQAPKSFTTMEEAIKLFLETKLREEIRADSERTYRSLLGILAEWLRVNGRLKAAVGTFTEEDAIAFMDHCFVQRNISKRTYNNYRAFYGTLCLWWKKHKYLRGNPFDVVERKKFDKRRKSRRMLTDEERARVRIYLQEHDPRFLAFSLIMFHCALRPKEVFYLQPRHVDLARQCIHVDAEFSKNGFSRVAAIPDVVVGELAALGIDRQDPEEYIFSDDLLPGRNRKRSTYSGKQWVKVRDALGLPMECKHYSLRDTAVLQLARDDVSRVDSQNHYDHHSAAMHDIYSRAAQDSGNDVVRKKMTKF